MLCKQQCTLGRKSPDESVAFDMSSTLVDRMEDAKAKCEAAFEVVDDKIREAEDHYAEVGGQSGDFKASFDRFGEFLATAEDSDSDECIDNPLNKKYDWKCKFCPAKLDTRATLKDHVETEHQDDWFKYLCGQCDFGAEGPRDLTEHTVSAHGSQSDLSAATIAIIGLQLDGQQVTRSGTSGRRGIKRHSVDGNEITSKNRAATDDQLRSKQSQLMYY